LWRVLFFPSQKKNLGAWGGKATMYVRSSCFSS